MKKKARFAWRHMASQTRHHNLFIFCSYSVAATTERVVTFRPHTTIVESEVVLSIYERVLNIIEAPSVYLPLFISLIRVHNFLNIFLKSA